MLKSHIVEKDENTLVVSQYIPPMDADLQSI